MYRGTNHPLNLIDLCIKCHHIAHNGSNTDKQNEVLKTCYDQIRNNLDVCYTKGKTENKIVNLIEQGDL